MPATSPMLSLLVALILLFLGFPLIVIVVLSFNAAPDLVFPPKALSLDWYANIFRTEVFAVGFWQSLLIASIATSIAIMVVVPAISAMPRSRWAGRRHVL